jgi:hypothetical protein
MGAVSDYLKMFGYPPCVKFMAAEIIQEKHRRRSFESLNAVFGLTLSQSSVPRLPRHVRGIAHRNFSGARRWTNK